MNIRGFVATAVLSASVVSGCAASEDGDLDADLDSRVGPGEFWDWFPNRPGNGDIEVHEGDDTDVPDCIIWDIDGASVSRQVQSGWFEERFVIDDNEIFSADPEGGPGALACSVVEDDHPSGRVFHVEDAAGTVQLTMWGKYVFEGDVEIPSVGSEECSNLIQNEVDYSFKKDQIFEGPWWQGNVIATADARIDKANPMRRMVLGALVAGACGSQGLP